MGQLTYDEVIAAIPQFAIDNCAGMDADEVTAAIHEHFGAPPKPPKPLKSLVQHDSEASERHFIPRGHIASGIACPDCGAELSEPPNMQLLTHPPRVPVYCKACLWNGSRLA